MNFMKIAKIMMLSIAVIGLFFNSPKKVGGNINFEQSRPTIIMKLKETPEFLNYENIGNDKELRNDIEELQKWINRYQMFHDENSKEGMGDWVAKNYPISDPLKSHLNSLTNSYWRIDSNRNKVYQEIQCVGYVGILAELYPHLFPYILGINFKFPGEIIPEEIKGRYMVNSKGLNFINPNYVKPEKIPESGLFLGSKHVGAFSKDYNNIIVTEANCDRSRYSNICDPDGDVRTYDMVPDEFLKFLKNNGYVIATKP